MDCLHACNFWSYGQFLDEIKSPFIQDFFLKGQYKLVDATETPTFKSVVSNTIDEDTDDIPF